MIILLIEPESEPQHASFVANWFVVVGIFLTVLEYLFFNYSLYCVFNFMNAITSTLLCRILNEEVASGELFYDYFLTKLYKVCP